MFDDIRDDYRSQLESDLRVAHSISENSVKALAEAIKHHCRGEMVPEEVACLCREQAVNLDRDLLKNKGFELSPIFHELEDYSKT